MFKFCVAITYPAQIIWYAHVVLYLVTFTFIYLFVYLLFQLFICLFVFFSSFFLLGRGELYLRNSFEDKIQNWGMSLFKRMPGVILFYYWVGCMCKMASGGGAWIFIWMIFHARGISSNELEIWAEVSFYNKEGWLLVIGRRVTGLDLLFIFKPSSE